MLPRTPLTRTRSAVLSLALGLLPTLLAAADVAAADSARLGLHRISSYEIISDKILIIEATGKKNYRAELFPGCFGLRHAYTLAFQTKGGNSLDKFSSVVLPDGTRCRFKSFVLIPEFAETPLQGDIESPAAP